MTDDKTRPAVLMVDDDDKLNELIAGFLSANGYSVSVVTDGEAAIDSLRHERPSLVILDVMLPGANGLSVCASARSWYSGPILMMTALGSDIDHVAGLECGADGYLTKPVAPRVLLANVRALLRHHQLGAATQTRCSPSGCVSVGRLSVDPAARRASLASRELDLTDAEFDLLWLLARSAGRVLSRDEISLRLRGFEHDGLNRTLDLRVSHLRRKLGDNARAPTLIKSVRGAGYMMLR